MGNKSTGKPGAASVRKFRLEDADVVTSISEQSAEAANWSKESYLNFSQQIGSLALVAETDGNLSGFLIGRLTGDQAEILNLAVSASQRRRGNGHALLAAAHAEFALQGAQSVYLEVRQSNTAAIAFYKATASPNPACAKAITAIPTSPPSS